MLTAEIALKRILDLAVPLATETVPLARTLGRRLARSIVAPFDSPIFDNAAMDGFALRAGDTAGATQQAPVSLKVVGRVVAGPSGSLPFLKGGEAVRIMTGAPLSPGADAVVPFEEARQRDGHCFVTSLVQPGANVRQAGEEFHRGMPLLAAGVAVTSRTIALLASVGQARVEVFARPSVNVIVTGNELIKPGNPLAPGCIYNSNGPALQAALAETGIEKITTGVAPDTEPGLSRALRKGLKGDVVITVGGVSAGDLDLVPKVLPSLGVEIIFHQVAIKPGKPLLFATREGTLIFGLPGNPVSALMVFDRFVRPALLKMMGAAAPHRTKITAVVDEEIRGSAGKEDYLRGAIEFRDGALHARLAGTQGSAHLGPLARANGIIILPPERQRVLPRETVVVELFGEVL